MTRFPGLHLKAKIIEGVTPVVCGGVRFTRALGGVSQTFYEVFQWCGTLRRRHGIDYLTGLENRWIWSVHSTVVSDKG